jgi:diguanylate cyclase (GGDEF)-like protein
MLVFIILLGLSVFSILLLGYGLFTSLRHLVQVKEKLVTAEKTLSQEVERKHSLNAEMVEMKHKIEKNIVNDSLTGLPGWHLFEDRLRQVLTQSKRHQLTFSILFLDLDDFKIINDVLGLQAGDELLKEVAARLQFSIRQMDTVSRFTGDEFVFLLPQISKPETAAYIAQRLLNAVAQPFRIGEQELFITASAGVAIFPNDGEEIPMLLQNAESALHQAKTQGDNNYQFYRREMHIISRRELILSSGLHSPTIYQEFSLYYQPQIDIAAKQIACMETYLQWKHPDFGIIASNDFLRFSENTGTIMLIGEWILRSACQQFLTWQSLGLHPQKLAVNVSLRQLENPHFAYNVSRVLQELNLNPDVLILQISEVMLLMKLGLIEKTLRMLKQMGIHIGVTDFGTGNIALQHLRSFPLSYLKLSSTLLEDVTQNEETKAILKMIMALANTLQLTVVADGVEKVEQKLLLKELGPCLMQGPIFSPPLLPEDFTALVKEKIVESV